MRKKFYIMLVTLLVALSWGMVWQAALAADFGKRAGKGSIKLIHYRGQRHRHKQQVRARYFRQRPRVRLYFGFYGPLYPYLVYPGYYRPVVRPIPRPVIRYGTLRIEVQPADVEIIVDGRFIGLAGDFQGPAEVVVARGSHVIEFKLADYQTYTQVYVAAGSLSVVNRDLSPFLPSRPSPGSSLYRYYGDAPAGERAVFGKGWY
jgi:hypothetical protein